MKHTKKFTLIPREEDLLCEDWLSILDGQMHSNFRRKNITDEKKKLPFIYKILQKIVNFPLASKSFDIMERVDIKQENYQNQSVDMAEDK
ncbi:hypothetical protein TNCT_696461 [Trichonephila clavata]|uniref:Uncharacterized protein n=1 Tax=Trichonephila clavata TaxID=2740835 RepID=A0A8X6HVS9_TRICU|nr:hypothetical protein TNCT_696461 [Trichonephila clavata]